jgi:hypothetical protein
MALCTDHYCGTSSPIFATCQTHAKTLFLCMTLCLQNISPPQKKSVRPPVNSKQYTQDELASNVRTCNANTLARMQISDDTFVFVNGSIFQVQAERRRRALLLRLLLTFLTTCGSGEGSHTCGSHMHADIHMEHVETHGLHSAHACGHPYETRGPVQARQGDGMVHQPLDAKCEPN